MEQDGLIAFDAYHVAYAAGDTLISSDKSIDHVATDRIPLEATDDP